MVYSIKYTVDVLSANPSAKEQLEASMDEQASGYEDAFADLKKEVPSAESLIVEYINSDGTVLASREYTE